MDPDGEIPSGDELEGQDPSNLLTSSTTGSVDKPRAPATDVPVRKKKLSKYERLEENWNKKFSSLTSKLDQLLENSLTQSQGNGNSLTQSQGSRNSVSQRQRKVRTLSDSESSESDGERSVTCRQDDEISINAGGKISDSESLHTDSDSDINNNVKLSSATKKCLFNIFGEDAVVKEQEARNGILIDQSQKDVLDTSYRTITPNTLTAFNEENFDLFPVDTETDKYLEVPSLDNMVESCLIQRHGAKASFAKNKQKALFSQPSKMIEKIAYKGQQASKLGIIMQLYIQQSLGNLVQDISDETLSKKDTLDQIQNIFAMTTKCLDQVGRSGAFHHIVRRTATMADTTLYQLEDSAVFSNLPLSGEGVLGPGLEDLFKSRKEKKKQIEDLLPDINRKRKSDSSPHTVGQHSGIRHARCLVDSGFAHIKNRYRNHDCETLAQLTALVDQSSATNTAVSYPTWTWRKWKPFLEVYFKPVPGIMQYQYFRFDQSKPGIVVVKIQHDGEEKELQILKTPTFRFQNVERPQSVSSAGLSDERRQYLRRSVSRYVRPASKDYFFGN